MSWPWSLSLEVPSTVEGDVENTRISSVQHQQTPSVRYSTAATVTSSVSSQAYLQHVQQQQRLSGLYALNQQHALPAVPRPVTSTAQMHQRLTRDLSSWFISEPQFTSPSGSFTNTLFQQIPPSMSRGQRNTETRTSFLHMSQPPATSQHVPVTSAAFNFPLTDITESQFSSRPLEQGQWKRSLGNYESNNPENVEQGQGNLENELIYQPFTPGNISRILPLGQQSNPGFRNSQTPIGPSEQGQFNIVNLLRTNRPVCLTHQSSYPGTHQYHQSSLQPEQQALPSVIPSGTTLSTAHQSLPGYSQVPGVFQNEPSESHLSQFTTYPSFQNQPVSPESSTSTPLTEPMVTASSRSSVSSEVTAVTKGTEQEDPLLQGIQ